MPEARERTEAYAGRMTRHAPRLRNDPVAEARGRPLAHAILELLWHRKEITRADLARETGLARSTVSDLVGRLLDTDLVVESGDAPSSGGRKPVILRFQDDARRILGVDLGATHVAVTLTDLRGHMLHWAEESFPVRDDPDGACATTVRMCEEALDALPGSRDKLIGLGIAVPAPVEFDAEDQLSEVVMPAWAGHTGLRHVAEQLGVPLRIENDANVGALAEAWWGGVDEGDFTFIKIATGVGSGSIIGGEIYRGATGVAGEIGHVSIDPAGPECRCGNRGCLTTFVGTRELLDRVVELAPDFPASPLASGDPTLDDLVDATLADDPLALHVIGEAAAHLGTAVAGLLNLLNPGAVILGGSLMRVGDHLLDPIREAVRTRTLLTSMLGAHIRTSELGDRNIALGAATLVLARALESPDLFLLAP